MCRKLRKSSCHSGPVPSHSARHRLHTSGRLGRCRGAADGRRMDEVRGTALAQV